MFFKLRFRFLVFTVYTVTLVACNRPQEQEDRSASAADTSLERSSRETGNTEIQAEASDPEPPASGLEGSSPLIPATKKVDAPDFSLPDGSNKSFRLSEHRDKVVVLNFWATWCPPCREEIPDFIELQRSLEKEGVLFVGISVDEEGWEVIKPFVKDYAINYPIVLDDGKASELYGPISGLPTTFVIDRKGVVRYFSPGMLSGEVLRPALIKLLAEKS